jgi:anti-sigma factor RsiW
MEVLQSYLDGEIDAATARQVAAHLADCGDCDLESTTYRKIKVSLATTSMPLDPTVLANLRAFSERVARGELD